MDPRIGSLRSCRRPCPPEPVVGAPFQQQDPGPARANSSTPPMETKNQSVAFRWEKELTPLVESSFDRLIPNPAQGAPDLLAAEIPAAVGVVDLLGVKVRTDAVAIRERLGVGPICSPLRIRVLDLLAAGQIKNISTLARRLGSSERSLRSSTLVPLGELGLIELHGPQVHSTGCWMPIGEAVTAVELKLSKWRSALRQADNFSLSADHSWVVLDQARAKGAQDRQDLFRALGVGLATIDEAGAIRTLVRPRLRPPTRWLKALIAERAWAVGQALSEKTQPGIEKTSSRALLHEGRQPFPEANCVFQSGANRGFSLS